MHDKSEILQIYLYDELVYKMWYIRDRYENVYVMSIVVLADTQTKTNLGCKPLTPDTRLNLS